MSLTHRGIPENAPACHIVGAGISGLSAAQQLVNAGFRVYIYEAAGHAGGRCRSLPDKRLGATIDNGSHLIFTANTATRNFLNAINAPKDGLKVLEGLSFYDLQDKASWTIKPSGNNPLWLLGKGFQNIGISTFELLKDAFKLHFAKPDAAIGECLNTDTKAWRRLWMPFLEAVFNTDPETVSARHAYKIMKALTLKGAVGGRPIQAVRPWSELIAYPAESHLKYHGAVFTYHRPLVAFDRADNRVKRMIFRSGTIDTASDYVILATPNTAANRLLPDIVPDLGTAPILNVHFEINEDLGLGLQGMVGGLSDWVFWRGKTVSITIGNAQKYLDVEAKSLAHTVWAEARQILPSTLPVSPPPHRRIVEKRATISVTPEAFAKRPQTETPDHNLFLAGDWVQTDLPSTIEGAVVSGINAANAVISKAK